MTIRMLSQGPALLSASGPIFAGFMSANAVVETRSRHK